MSKLSEIEIPLTTVSRIIKKPFIPESISISKEARSAYSKALSIFIMYLTSSANSVALGKKRSTIQGNDVLEALNQCDFADMIPDVQFLLDATRNKAADTKKKNSGESKVKQSAQVTNVQDADVDNDSNDVENGMASKKSKLNDSFNMEESSVNEVVNAEESSVNDVLNVEDSFVEEDVVPDVSPMDADE